MILPHCIPSIKHGNFFFSITGFKMMWRKWVKKYFEKHTKKTCTVHALKILLLYLELMYLRVFGITGKMASHTFLFSLVKWILNQFKGKNAIMQWELKLWDLMFMHGSPHTSQGHGTFMHQNNGTMLTIMKMNGMILGIDRLVFSTLKM